MSFALLYSLVRFLLDALLTRRQSELRLGAEVLALRHQLRVLERKVRRPRWQRTDRLLLTALSHGSASPSLVPFCSSALRPSSAGIAS
jgi:hypothetical protein